MLDWSRSTTLWPNVSLVDLVDIDRWLAVQESAVSNLRPDCAKTVIWAGEKDSQTEIAVVFNHGFSATYNEIRPLPDLVAKTLGANLYFTRLTGHGQDGADVGGQFRCMARGCSRGSEGRTYHRETCSGYRVFNRVHIGCRRLGPWGRYCRTGVCRRTLV